MFPSIIIIARANGRTADGADIFPRLIHPGQGGLPAE